jgi:hypothetical protein
MTQDKTKITMLGKSGSGKTSFLAGLYEVLGAQDNHDFQLQPRGDTLYDSLVSFGEFLDLSFTSKGLRFPDANARRNVPKSTSYDLLHHFRNIAEIELLDYRGAILDDPVGFELEQEELNVVLDHLLASRMAVIFADSFLLTYFADLNQTRAQTGASLFNHILASFGQKYPNEHLVCLIVLTKVDALHGRQENYWVADNYNWLIQRAKDVFEPIIGYTRNRRRWVTGIVPVTVVGEGNATSWPNETPNNPAHPVTLVTNLLYPPQPMNVEHAFFFCVQETFRNFRRRTLARLAELTGEIAAIEYQLRRQRQGLPANPGDKAAGRLERLRQEHDQCSNLADKYNAYIDLLTPLTHTVVTRI